MKKIFKCKNLFLVTFLAVAGIFSAGSVIVNKKADETPVVEKAEASSKVYPNRIMIEGVDQTGEGAFNSYNNRMGLRAYDITFDSSCAFSTIAQASDAGALQATCGTKYYRINSDGSIDVEGQQASYYSDVSWKFYFPWFITGFNYKFFRWRDTAWVNTPLNVTSRQYECRYVKKGGEWYVDNSKTTAANTYEENQYRLTYTSNGGTSKGYVDVKAYEKVSPPKSNPIKDGYSFLKWTGTNSYSAEEYTFSYLTQDKEIFAQYESPLNTKRIWLWRSTHYVGSGEEWRIWDGVSGHAAYAPRYVQINQWSSIYLAYFDIPLSVTSIHFQIFTNDNYTTEPVNSISYTSGMNSHLWVVYEPSNLAIDTSGTVGSMDSSGTDWKVDAATLTLVFKGYLTCSNNADNGYPSINNVYASWVYGNDRSWVHDCVTQEEANAILVSTTYSDYSNGSDYSNPSQRTVSTSLYQKYLTMSNMRTKGKVKVIGSFTPFLLMGEGENSINVIIIIIASSISILSITALSVLMVKKRKSKEQ